MWFNPGVTLHLAPIKTLMDFTDGGGGDTSDKNQQNPEKQNGCN